MLFFKRWPSSQINRSITLSISLQIFLNVSYDVNKRWYGEYRKYLTYLLTSSLDPIADNGYSLIGPNHFLISFSQLPINETGHVITIFDISFDCIKIHINVIAYKVFPNPILSAKMHPLIDFPLLPVTHSNINFTPSI